MALRVGEQTVHERMEETKLEIRRLMAEHQAALRKYNGFRDQSRRLTRTAAMDAKERELLATCQGLWQQLGEQNDLLRWQKYQVDQHRAKKNG